MVPQLCGLAGGSKLPTASWLGPRRLSEDGSRSEVNRFKTPRSDKATPESSNPARGSECSHC